MWVSLVKNIFLVKKASTSNTCSSLRRKCAAHWISFLPQTFQCLLLNVYFKTRKEEFVREQSGRQDPLKKKTVPQKMFVSKEASMHLPVPSLLQVPAQPFQITIHSASLPEKMQRSMGSESKRHFTGSSRYLNVPRCHRQLYFHFRSEYISSVTEQCKQGKSCNYRNCNWKNRKKTHSHTQKFPLSLLRSTWAIILSL